MKSRITATFLLTVVLTSLLVGGIGGWLGRGMFSERPAAEASTGSASVNHSSPSAAPANVSSAQRLRSAHVAQSNLTAKQLLQQVMDKSVPSGKEELFLARFRTAVISCDEAAVAEMAAMLVAIVKPSEDPFAGQDIMLLGCSRELTMRMLALNPPKALEFLVLMIKGGLGDMRAQASQVLDCLNEQELRDAAELMKPWLGPVGYESLVFSLMNARLKFDAEGVYQDLMNLGPSNAAIAMSGDLLTRLGLEYPAKALQVMARFPDHEPHFIPARLKVLKAWFASQPTEAGKWVMEQNRAEIFREALNFAKPEGGGLDVKLMRDNFSKVSASSDRARISLAGDIAGRSAEIDLEGTIRWSMTLPTEEQARANLQIFPKWLNQDSAAASAWLATWPAGKDKDSAIMCLIDNIANEDPEAALVWAANIQSNLRFEMMITTLDKMNVKDPAAAERARQSLSESDRAKLISIKELERNKPRQKGARVSK